MQCYAVLVPVRLRGKIIRRNVCTAVAVHTRGNTPLRLLLMQFCIGLALRISANNTAITTASVGLKPNSAPFGDTLISRSTDLSVRFDNPTHKK